MRPTDPMAIIFAGLYRLGHRILGFQGLIAAIVLCAAPATAQELRYSWFDISYMGQDVDRFGSLPSPGVPDQIVDVAVTDGNGIRFRGSVGTWKNMYLMFDYSSTDISLTGSVTNPITPPQDFADEFDYTAIRGGVGFKYSVGFKTDIFGELTYDSLDFDFGSFAGENFDMDRQEWGGTAGIRTLFGDDFELRLHGRYSNVGDADLTTGFFETDTLYGAGFGWQLIRGLYLVGDIEIGEFSSWSIGFRLDLDED